MGDGWWVMIVVTSRDHVITYHTTYDVRRSHSRITETMAVTGLCRVLEVCGGVSSYPPKCILDTTRTLGSARQDLDRVEVSSWVGSKQDIARYRDSFLLAPLTSSCWFDWVLRVAVSVLRFVRILHQHVGIILLIQQCDHRRIHRTRTVLATLPSSMVSCPYAVNYSALLA